MRKQLHYLIGIAFVRARDDIAHVHMPSAKPCELKGREAGTADKNVCFSVCVVRASSTRKIENRSFLNRE